MSRSVHFERLDRNRKIAIKDLQSFADFGSSFWKEGAAIHPTVSRLLIKRAAQASETVDSIIRHMTDDIVNVPRRIVAASKFKEPKKSNVEKLETFLGQPNPDDNSDEWLENYVYDLLLYGDAFWEKSGTKDSQVKAGTSTKNFYKGDLKAIWHVPAYTVYILGNELTGQLPVNNIDMCWEQKVGHYKNQFNREKFVRASRFRLDRLYGTSPLQALLNIIAGQLNLTGYVGNLFSGEIPKTLVNVGKMNSSDFAKLKMEIQNQLQDATNPYGLLALNVPNNFQIHKLIESSGEAQLLETLKYYREEICASFGMPPSKMGWSTPGKIGNEDNMDDAYYDIVETVQRKVEKSIYNGISRSLGTPDCYMKFNSSRPKRIKVESEARSKNARAIQVGRQEGIMTVNEARTIYELDPLPDSWANDPRYPSPTVAIPAEPDDEEEPEEEPEEEEEEE